MFRLRYATADVRYGTFHPGDGMIDLRTPSFRLRTSTFDIFTAIARLRDTPSLFVDKSFGDFG